VNLMISRGTRSARDLNLILKGLRNLMNEVNMVKMITENV